jgi:hypothetical protein
MRVDEFTSAEEQMALWKLVSDNVWAAIATQAEQERRAKAEKAARSKPKRGRRSSSPTAAKPTAPKPPVPPKPVVDTGKKPQPSAAAQQPVISAPVQPNGPNGAPGLQTRTPIQPIAPVVTSAATPPVQQALPKEPKPRITARAGGMTT